MANVSRIMGFRPVKHLNGASWNGKITRYWVPASDATAIGIGDLVSLAAVSDTFGTRGVTKTAVGGASIGAVVGVEINPLNLNTPQYRAASQATYVYVADQPDVIYEAQLSGTYTVAATISKNANHVDGGISATTGLSGEQVDATTLATTATLTLKIFGFDPGIANDLTAVNPKVLVSINNHQLANGVAGV